MHRSLYDDPLEAKDARPAPGLALRLLFYPLVAGALASGRWLRATALRWEMDYPHRLFFAAAGMLTAVWAVSVAWMVLRLLELVPGP